MQKLTRSPGSAAPKNTGVQVTQGNSRDGKDDRPDSGLELSAHLFSHSTRVSWVQLLNLSGPQENENNPHDKCNQHLPHSQHRRFQPESGQAGRGHCGSYISTPLPDHYSICQTHTIHHMPRAMPGIDVGSVPLGCGGEALTLHRLSPWPELCTCTSVVHTVACRAMLLY